MFFHCPQSCTTDVEDSIDKIPHEKTKDKETEFQLKKTTSPSQKFFNALKKYSSWNKIPVPTQRKSVETRKKSKESNYNLSSVKFVDDTHYTNDPTLFSTDANQSDNESEFDDDHPDIMKYFE
eukprot:gene2391-2855_t